MSRLTDVLDRFNRKERNLLIRDILGHSVEQALPITASFRKRVGKALGIEVPADAWWATDYHLNWIAAAVAVLRDGEQPSYDKRDNLQEGTRRLIERSQEDADLLIAFDQTLILVEVKAFGTFTNKQINSKVQRWRLLKQFCNAGPEKDGLTLHFMLMSRTEPTKLDPSPNDFLPSRKWPHAELIVPAASDKLVVTGKKRGPESPAVEDKFWYVARILPASENEQTAAEIDDLSAPDMS